MAKIKAAENGSKFDVITKKAASLFRQKGFASCTMRELAESLGVEAPSLYNHIGSKSEMLQSICFKVAKDFTHHLNEVEKTEGSTVSKLENIIRFHIRMMIESFDEVHVANREWKQMEDPFLTNFLNQRKNYERRLADIINEGIRKGELKNTNPHVAVLVILSAVRGLEFWQRHKITGNPATLEDDMVNQLLNGITL